MFGIRLMTPKAVTNRHGVQAAWDLAEVVSRSARVPTAVPRRVLAD
jgi:hypothetical protein